MKVVPLDLDNEQALAWTNPDRVVEITIKALGKYKPPKPNQPLDYCTKGFREGIVHRALIALPSKAVEIAVGIPEFAEYAVEHYPELAAEIALRLPDQAGKLALKAFTSLQMKKYCSESMAAQEGNDISGSQIIFDVVRQVPESAPMVVDHFNFLAAKITGLVPHQAKKIVKQSPQVAADVSSAVPNQALDIAIAYPDFAVAIALKVPERAEQIKQHFRM